MPLQQTSGNVTSDAYGGGVAVEPVYIEQIFSTYLYTGNGSTQTITNGIDLSGKGGLVWQKSRTSGFAYTSHILHSPNVTSGTNQLLLDSATTAGAGVTIGAYTYLSTGFSINGGFNDFGNASGQNYASWTFRKQPKFFDVVTYTGNGSTQTINHNLGSVPGCIIVKNVSNTSNWPVYHRGYSSLGGSGDIIQILNNTNAAFFSTAFNNTLPTSTNFQVGLASGTNNTNVNGDTYVAYLFAHDAGGFGLTGTDNVISCGSFTTDSAGEATVSVGYEPQWLLVKSSTSAEDWYVVDNMRGLVANGVATKFLNPNLSAAESTGDGLRINATGFGASLTGSKTYIYIAIRRGPMKVPTSGTSVFAPVLNTGTGANTNISSGGFAPDTLWNKTRDHSYGLEAWDKLRGVTQIFEMTSPSAEVSGPTGYDLVSFNNTGVTEGVNSSSTMNISGWTYVNYLFGRAPNFYDTVCYTGTGVARTVTHNLGVAPEMMIVKMRTNDPTFGGMNWTIYHSALGNTKGLYFTNTAALGPNIGFWNNTTPTSSVFSLGTDFSVNDSNGGPQPFVAYLFATCAGVSKVGSYTGNGSTQTIDCGFTGGARFVLIKRTDSTGDWYTYDTARGMTTLTDPYLLLNSTAAESATLGSVTTVSTGFALNAGILAAINTNGASYIFLAIA